MLGRARSAKYRRTNDSAARPSAGARLDTRETKEWSKEVYDANIYQPVGHLLEPALCRWRLAAVAATTPATVEAQESQNH